MSRQFTFNTQLPPIKNIGGCDDFRESPPLYKTASQHIDEKLAEKYGLTEFIKMRNTFSELNEKSGGKPVSLKDVCKLIDEKFGGKK